MTIINSVQAMYQGIPAVWATNVNVNVQAGNSNALIPGKGAFVPTGFVNRGYIRVKNEGLNVNANHTFKVLQITCTDGANLVQVYSGDSTLTSNSVRVDNIYEFNVDINVTNINIVMNANNSNGVYSFEVAGS